MSDETYEPEDAVLYAALWRGLEEKRKQYPSANTIRDLIAADRLQRIASGTWEEPPAPRAAVTIICDRCETSLGTYELRPERVSPPDRDGSMFKELWTWRPDGASELVPDYLLGDTPVSKQTLRTIREGIANGSMPRRHFDLHCDCEPNRNVQMRDETANEILTKAVNDGVSDLRLSTLDAWVRARGQQT